MARTKQSKSAPKTGIKLISRTFEDGHAIPKKHAFKGVGQNISPSLRWGNDLPAGTQELALICEDPDAPRDEPFVHWVVYGIPPGVQELREGSVPEEETLREGRNDFGELGYGGPKPPEGHGVHHYHFRLYALDRPLGLESSGARKEEVLRRARGHILGEGELVGTFER